MTRMDVGHLSRNLHTESEREREMERLGNIQTHLVVHVAESVADIAEICGHLVCI